MVTFADMMSLLLCLFVLLLSFSEIDSNSFKKNAGPISDAFGLTKTTPETPNPTSSPTRSFIMEPTFKVSRPELRIVRMLQTQLAQEIANSIISLDVTDDYVIIRFPGTAAFPSGSATVSEGFLPTLKRIADVLTRTEGDILVAGHTDSEPIHSSQFRSNWDLSSARAVSVVHELLNDPRIPPYRMTAQGFADTRPLAPNDTEEHRSINRRVEISIEIPIVEG
jgi:chemotaxis protein MotB